MTDGEKVSTMSEKSYKPMNKCPDCGERDSAVCEISKDGKTYTLLCTNCMRKTMMPQAQVKLGIITFNPYRTLVGYFHWGKDADVFQPEGTRIDWDTLEVA
jgi:transcription elongation factor Elf1